MAGNDTGWELLPRYKLRRELGRGASSCVYEVLDRPHGIVRALKLSMRKGSRRKYRDEFLTLSEFRHPSIVRALEFGLTASGYPYYTLELVRGHTLDTFAGRADARQLAIVSLQMLDALSVIHARGYVHRDIKPSNILLAGEGAGLLANLIDFGLLVRSRSATAAAGTLPYVAPEVAREEIVDGRADLYSLGVMLYESLAPEGVAKDLQEVAKNLAHAHEPLARLNPLVPARFSEWVMRLMAPDREERFPSAQAAIQSLTRISELGVGAGPKRAAVERRLQVGAVSHRHAAIERVRRLARKARSSEHGACCLVVAPQGVGKTPFLRELLARLSVDGMQALVFRPTGDPGVLVPSLVRAADALVEAEPSRQRRQHSSTSRMTGYAGMVARHVAVGLRDKPTVLIVDDVHLVEPVALDVLRSLSSEIEDAPVLVVCAADSGAHDDAITAGLGASYRLLRLEPLTQPEIEELVRHRLVGLELPMPALARVAADSEGMPSLTEKILARMLADGAIQFSEGKHAFFGGRYRAAKHVDQELVGARLASVTEAQRPVLEAAAILGQHLHAHNVAHVAGASVTHAADILAQLVLREVLEPKGVSGTTLFAFASRDIRQAVLTELEPKRRREMHAQAARAVEHDASHPDPIWARVDHLFKSSDTERGVALALRAGENAAHAFADRRAIAYFGRVHNFLKTSHDLRRVVAATRLGELYERKGDLDRAAVWYRAALDGPADSEDARDPDAHVRAMLGLGSVALVRGDLAAAHTQAIRVRNAIAEADNPDLVARARRLEALVARQRGEYGPANDLFKESFEYFENAGDESSAIEILLNLATMARARGELVRAVKLGRKAYHRARRLGDPAALAEACSVVGRGYLRAGRFSAARTALQRGVRYARDSGDRVREGGVLREIGNVRVRQGALAQAVAVYERALGLVRAAGVAQDESACLHNIGLVRARMGEFRAAFRALEEAVRVAQKIGDVQGLGASLFELAHAHAIVGRLDAAHRALDRATELAVRIDDPVTRAESSALRAFLRGGRMVDDCAETVAKLRRDLELLEDPANRALVTFYAARCALDHDAGAMAEELAIALQREVKEGVVSDFAPFSEGLSAMVAHCQGEDARALEGYRSAAAMANAHGMRPWEVEMLRGIGTLEEGRQRTEAWTRSMELMREIVQDLPAKWAEAYLARPAAKAIRTGFREQWARVREAGF